MFNHRLSRRQGLLVGVAAVTVCLALPTAAQPAARDYDLPAQALGRSLAEVAKVTGRQVMVASGLVRGKTAPALKGRYTPEQAYAALLADQGLKVTPVGAVLVLQPARLASPLGETAPAAADALSEIVVTGTRIRGAAPVGSNLISITREDIDRAGFATAQQIVQSVPQNFGGGPGETTSGYSSRNGAPLNTNLGSSVNLRGLGANSTLVLINGSRPPGAGIAGSFTDISVIPVLAIQGVEVLADGASALYGSDAVAGVVNFKMRDAFDGGEARVRYGRARGGAREIQVGAMLGQRWATGNIAGAYEYYDRQALAASRRDYATEDLRPFGGADYRRPYAAPGTLVVSGQTFAIPKGQNGVGLTPGQLAAGQQNLADEQADTDLVPAQRRHSLYVSGRQAFGPRTHVFAQALVAQRDFEQRSYGGTQRSVVVPTTNPFYLNPLGGTAPVSVQYDFRGDLGTPRSTGRVRAYNGLFGLDRELGAWSASAQVGLGLQRERYQIDNQGPNTYRLAIALADPNPATAYNLFGDPGSTPAATRDAVRGSIGGRSQFRSWTGALRADGPVATLPAGAAKLALGAEWRSERYVQTNYTDLFAATPTATETDYPDTRTIAAAYAEVRLPLVDEAMGVAAVRSLELSLAGRVERYSDVGKASTPKVGLDWRPLTDLTVRASYGKSFRAPSFQDLRTGPTVTAYQPALLPDPASPTGYTTVLALLGNSPDMGPERATTWTTGLSFKPHALPGLAANLTYYDIRYEDRIANVNANAFNLLIERNVYADVIADHPSAATVAAYYASPLLSNRSNIPASAIAAIVDLQNRNLSSVRQRGLDFDVSYGREVGAGQVSLGLAGSYIFAINQKITSTSPTADVVGTVGNPADLRVRGRAGWNQGPWSVSGFVNFIDGYENQLVTPRQAVKSWTTADLQLAYRPASARLAGLRFALTVTNLLDRDPPFVEMRTIGSAIGYDGEKADPMGRRIAFEVIRAW